MEASATGDPIKSSGQSTGSLQAIISKLSMGRTETREGTRRRAIEQHNIKENINDNKVNRTKDSHMAIVNRKVPNSVSCSARGGEIDEQEIQLDTEKPLLSVGHIKIEPIDPIDSEDIESGNCPIPVVVSSCYPLHSKSGSMAIEVSRELQGHGRQEHSSPKKDTGRKSIVGSGKERPPASESCSMVPIANSGHVVFTCDVCGLACNTKQSLDNHQIESHQKSDIFSCQFCNKVFTHQSARKVHMRIHFDVRPFQCPMCDKRFRGSSHLKDHIRTHTGERPFVCEICGKGFKQASDLRKHRPTHLNKKKFNCRICNGEFGRLSLFIDHMQTVHPAVHPMKSDTKKQISDTTHNCGCGERFPSAKKLNGHFQSCRVFRSGKQVTLNPTVDHALVPAMTLAQNTIGTETSIIHPGIARASISPTAILLPSAPVAPTAVLASPQGQKNLPFERKTLNANSHLPLSRSNPPQPVVVEPLKPVRNVLSSPEPPHRPTIGHLSSSPTVIPIFMSGPLSSFPRQGPVITTVTGSTVKVSQEKAATDVQGHHNNLVTTSNESSGVLASENLRGSPLPSSSSVPSVTVSKQAFHAENHDATVDSCRRQRGSCLAPEFSLDGRDQRNQHAHRPVLHQIILIQGASYKVLPLPLPSNNAPSVIVINQAQRDTPTLQVINMDGSTESSDQVRCGLGSRNNCSQTCSEMIQKSSSDTRMVLGLPIPDGDLSECSSQENQQRIRGDETPSDEFDTGLDGSPAVSHSRKYVSRNVVGYHRESDVSRGTDEESDYVCTKCNCSFGALSQLQQHKVFFHQAKGVFACNHCQLKFPTRNKLANHKVMHLSTLRAKLKCYLCGKRFRTEKMLVYHVVNKHQALCNNDRSPSRSEPSAEADARNVITKCGQYNVPNSKRKRLHENSHGVDMPNTSDTFGKTVVEKQPIHDPPEQNQ